MVIDPTYHGMAVAPGLMLDNFLPIPDTESLPFHPSVLKLVVCVSTSRFKSASQQLETVHQSVSASAAPPLYLQSMTASLSNYLPLVAFAVATERERERERQQW